MVVDTNGVPLAFTLSPGQDSDISNAQPVLERVRIPGHLGRPRKRCRQLIADKGYDAEHLRKYCDRHQILSVIPKRSMNRKPRPGRPREFDKSTYQQRNVIERVFGWLKEKRRIGTRYEKLATSFSAMITVACTILCFRKYFSYTA